MALESSRSKRRSSKSGDNTTKQEQKPPLKAEEQKEAKLKVLLKSDKREENRTNAKSEITKVKASKNEELKYKHQTRKDDTEEIAEKKDNLARKVIDFEEELATSRDSLSDVHEFQATCKSIENVITEINELKKGGNENQQEDLHTRRLDAMLLTTNLKKLNRLAQIRGNKAKESTQEVKKKVDLLHLDLQNLLYEIMHLRKEISKCMNFSSKDEEIDLISVEKFYEEAPEDISKPEITKTDPHQKMLSRLDYELKRRKELADQKKDCMEQKQKMEDELLQKADYLANLKPRLDQIIKAALPVQEYMGLPIEAERLLFEKAQYLPRPLYVLYVQAKAFKDVCDKELDVDIEGDIQAAKAAFTDESVDSELSGDESEEEKDAEKENGGESDGRGRKAKKETKTARLGVYQERLLKRHPFSVHITLKRNEHYAISLKFYHIPKLHICTVEVNLKLENSVIEPSLILSPNMLLNDLLTKDSGQQSPNTANKYQLEKFEMNPFSFYTSTIGLPYYWVQWICGLNYLPSQDIHSYTPNSMLSGKHFQCVVKMIRSRVDARLSLQEQLTNLEQLVIPLIKKTKGLNNCPKTVCVLTGWHLIYYEDILKYSSAERLVECGLVTEDCMFYEAKFVREETVNVGVVIPTNYPKQTPLFLLKLEGNLPINAEADILYLEREINTYTHEIVINCERNMILSYMLQKLQVCFDMFVETGPEKLTKEKLYTRKARGRDRNRPYVYHNDGYFVHR